jgi:heat-inducible transcriptional repressor
MSSETHPEDQLSERAQHLLRVLVQSYIREGQPVGSRALSRESGLSLSSATIRNVMSDLETLGFVSSPHTSAGRVPTDRGYRFFVNELLKVQLETESVELAALRREFDLSAGRPQSLIGAASELLSNLTQLAGLVTLPLPQAATLTQIEFIGLSENRVLVVMVMNDREVQNRIIQLERHHGAEELRRAANFLNEHCRGRTLAQVHQEMLRELKETHARLNQEMLDAIAVAQRLYEQTGAAASSIEYVIAGETNLMGLAELSSVDKLKRLFEAFNEKRDILNLLDHSLRADGVQIFIGHESGRQILDDCSVVTAPYGDGEGVVGVLGVIGPTRMAYERVIPIVDMTAKLLGAALHSRR